MHSKSLKMVFVARIIRHELCMIYAFFDFYVQKSLLTKNYFLTAEIKLTTLVPLYTCLVIDILETYKDLRAYLHIPTGRSVSINMTLDIDSRFLSTISRHQDRIFRIFCAKIGYF